MYVKTCVRKNLDNPSKVALTQPTTMSNSEPIIQVSS